MRGPASVTFSLAQGSEIVLHWRESTGGEPTYLQLIGKASVNLATSVKQR